ncbi:MAG: dienelactone hydrolase family protein [Phycisphaeraceae bacterium]
MNPRTLLAAALLLAPTPAVVAAEPAPAAEIETRTVTYEHDGVAFVGYLAQPAELADDAERPGVLVVHEWWGLNDFTRDRTERLAELGYVAFAADMYGQGEATDDPQQAGAWAGAVSSDRDEMRARAQAALDVLARHDNVAEDQLAAIGFCFGGTTAVELGYAAEHLKGVVSFHGNPQPAREQDENINASFLILHGAADPLVSDEDLDAFAQPLMQRELEHRIVRYDGARHSFTNPAADGLDNDAAAYHADAAERAWHEMQALFEDLFGEGD